MSTKLEEKLSGSSPWSSGQMRGRGRVRELLATTNLFKEVEEGFFLGIDWTRGQSRFHLVTNLVAVGPKVEF